MLIEANTDETCYVKLVDLLLMDIKRLGSCKATIFSVRYEFYTKTMQANDNRTFINN